ncbi:MAG: hypothetical protein WKF66_17290 [Pedobacter sp.]
MPTGIIIILAIILVIIIGLIYLIFRWLNKIEQTEIGLWLFTLIFFGLTYLIYTVLNPTDRFYKDEFENYTGLQFPESGKILMKNATYPDQHGDYSAHAVFKVDKKDFLKITEQIRKSIKFQIATDKFSRPTTNYKTQYLLNSRDLGLAFELKFDTKTNTIEMQRNSW